MAHPQSNPPLAHPGEAIELETSVAGEEDPGASIDLVAEEPPVAPGDAAPAATPGAGEKPLPQPEGRDPGPADPQRR